MNIPFDKRQIAPGVIYSGKIDHFALADVHVALTLQDT
jgi:hypothetical protein